MVKQFMRLAGVLLIGTCVCVAACSEKAAPQKSPSTENQERNKQAAEQVLAPALGPGTPLPDLLPFDDRRLKAQGDLDATAFARIMGKHKSSFKVCYKKALELHPEARGEMLVRFTISPTGRVSTVDVTDQGLNSPIAGTCLKHVIRRIRFPERTDSQRVTVEYPIVFAP